MPLLGWNDKLPVIQWLLSSADEAIAAVEYIQIILKKTDEATERKAIQDLVGVLHPVYWHSPFHAAEVESFAALPPNAEIGDVMTLLPQAPDGSRLRQAIAFLVEHADDAVSIILTLLALFGRKAL